jgi:hypothetical protein
MEKPPTVSKIRRFIGYSSLKTAHRYFEKALSASASLF